MAETLAFAAPSLGSEAAAERGPGEGSEHGHGSSMSGKRCGGRASREPAIARGGA